MSMEQFAKGRSLRQNSYHGIVLPDQDPKNMGRYKVHLPELQPLMEDNTGIWVKNQNHKWRYTPSKYYMSGQYCPLQEGCLVLVRFYEDDLNTGYIDRIISDQIEKSQPHLHTSSEPGAITDRDDVHVIFKTPKYHNSLMIFEDTKGDGLGSGKIPNSIHLYYNLMRSSLIIDTNGIHWFTMDNFGITVTQEYQKWVMGDECDWVCGTRSRVTNQIDYVGVVQSKHTKVGQESRHHSNMQHSTTSNFMISEDAPLIFLNSGRSQRAETGSTSAGSDSWGYKDRVIQKPFPIPKKDRPVIKIKK